MFYESKTDDSEFMRLQERVPTSYKTVPVLSDLPTAPDKDSVTMTIKKPGAILLAEIIMPCDYLPSTQSCHILHNSLLTLAHCHLISLPVMF